VIKFPLIALLLFCALYGWRQRSLSPIVGFLTPLTCMVGIALVMKPEWSSAGARALGVGRGADLILYVWTAISILVLANIHFRLRAQQGMITLLTRELALLKAKQPTKSL
jgi:hypothetical protein